jgi:Matrixin
MKRILTCTALMLLSASLALCFEVKTVSEISPTAYLAWETRDGAIGITLDKRGSADLSIPATEQALKAALNVWQSVSNQNVTFQYVGIADVQMSTTDHVNSVQWVEKNWQYSSHTLGVTQYSYYLEDPPKMIDADIILNGQDYRWAVNNADNRSKIDLQETLIHELGHLLGIAHTSVPNARMYPFITGAPTHKLSRDDKSAARYLYGAADSSFKLITPLRRARYTNHMSNNGLPLPVFRWGEGPDTNYVLEFSKTSDFANVIRVNAGPYPYYELTPEMEKKLIKLSALIFWRVRSGIVVTPARSFRFV